MKYNQIKIELRLLSIIINSNLKIKYLIIKSGSELELLLVRSIRFGKVNPENVCLSDM